MNPLTIAFIIFLVVYFIGSEVAKRYLYRRFEVWFLNEHYDECIRLLDGVPMRILFPRFNLFFMRMNVYMGRGDAHDVDYMIERLLSSRFSRTQRRAVIAQAVDFFERGGDTERASTMRKTLELLDSAPASKHKGARRN